MKGTDQAEKSIDNAQKLFHDFKLDRMTYEKDKNIFSHNFSRFTNT